MSEEAEKTIAEIVGEIVYSMDEMGYCSDKADFARLGNSIPKDLLDDISESISNYAEAYQQERIKIAKAIEVANAVIDAATEIAHINKVRAQPPIGEVTGEAPKESGTGKLPSYDLIVNDDSEVKISLSANPEHGVPFVARTIETSKLYQGIIKAADEAMESALNEIEDLCPTTMNKCKHNCIVFCYSKLCKKENDDN